MDDEKLTVYCIEVGEARKIVATENPYRAARLFEISRYLFSLHARTTESDNEVEVAMSDPGAVWARHIDSPEWIKCASSRKARGFEPQGGQRPGAGRPRSASTLRRQRSISADEHTWSTFRSRGGTAFLEHALNAGLAPSCAELSQLKALGGGKWLRQMLELPAASSDNPDRVDPDQSKSTVHPNGGMTDHPGVSQEQRKQRSISTDDETWALFLQRGGTRFFRALIESGIDLNGSEWKTFQQAGGQAWLQAALGNKR